MENAGAAAAGITILLFIFAIAIFWCMLPGFVCGSILKRSGRSYGWGFVLGIVFGPLGLLVCIIFAVMGKPQPSQTVIYAQPPAQESHYEETAQAAPRAESPFVWAVAGAMTLAAVLVLGVLVYFVALRPDTMQTGVTPSALVAPAPSPTAAPVVYLPAYSATPAPTATPAPAPTAEAEYEETPAYTPEPTATPTMTPTPAPTPSPTPKPSPTPAPTPAPAAQNAAAASPKVEATP